MVGRCIIFPYLFVKFMYKHASEMDFYKYTSKHETSVKLNKLLLRY